MFKHTDHILEMDDPGPVTHWSTINARWIEKIKIGTVQSQGSINRLILRIGHQIHDSTKCNLLTKGKGSYVRINVRVLVD